MTEENRERNIALERERWEASERESADYDRTAVFTRESSQQALEDAGHFCQACAALLARL